MKRNDNKRLPPSSFTVYSMQWPTPTHRTSFNVIEESLIDETQQTRHTTRKPKRPKRKLGSLSTKEGTDQRFNVANFSFAKRVSYSFPSQVYRNCTPSISSRPWDIWHGISRPTTIHGVENNVKFQLVCYSYWAQGRENKSFSFKKIRRRFSWVQTRDASSWAWLIQPTTRDELYNPSRLFNRFLFLWFFFVIIIILSEVTKGVVDPLYSSSEGIQSTKWWRKSKI